MLNPVALRTCTVSYCRFGRCGVDDLPHSLWRGGNTH